MNIARGHTSPAIARESIDELIGSASEGRRTKQNISQYRARFELAVSRPAQPCVRPYNKMIAG